MADSPFDKWMDEVDRLGIKERIFDKPGTHYLCPGSTIRRPYRGEDGLWFQLWQSGFPPRMALGESLVEQDGE